MESTEAARWLECPIVTCRGPVREKSHSWYFYCDICKYTWKPTDVGSLQRAIRNRTEQEVVRG